jgi:GTP 3',8-cyclase
MSENMTFLPKKELLTLEELDRMCSAFVRLGVEKLRITGGEPLVRKGHPDLLPRDVAPSGVGRAEGADADHQRLAARTLRGRPRRRGVRRINVSLDTLDEAKFAEITRWGRLPQVLNGIDAAQAAGLRSRSTPWRSRASTRTSCSRSWTGAPRATWT